MLEYHKPKKASKPLPPNPNNPRERHELERRLRELEGRPLAVLKPTDVVEADKLRRLLGKAPR